MRIRVDYIDCDTGEIKPYCYLPYDFSHPEKSKSSLYRFVDVFLNKNIVVNNHEALLLTVGNDVNVPKIQLEIF